MKFVALIYWVVAEFMSIISSFILFDKKQPKKDDLPSIKHFAFCENCCYTTRDFFSIYV